MSLRLSKAKSGSEVQGVSQFVASLQTLQSRWPGESTGRWRAMEDRRMILKYRWSVGFLLVDISFGKRY